MKRRGANGDQGSLVHALLYTRVSGAEHQREGLSLEAQRSATRDYAARQPGWIIAGEYEDIMSGKRADRPHYQAMLGHARQLHRDGKRAAIVVIRLDRLGRNKAEYFKTAEELARQGADVHSIKDGGVLDETHASILAVFAAKEAKDIGQRVGETRAGLVNGGYHYGRTPFGYRKRPATPEELASGQARRMASKDSTPHVFEPDPATRGVVLDVFERVAAGQSINAVSHWLAALPEALRGGRLWPAQCVTTMLRSPTYAARPAQGLDDVLARPRSRWEPIISDELYARVQEQIAGHAWRPHQASGRYLLTGFARCPRCGERMVGTMRAREDSPGTFRSDYRCSGWTRGANAPVPGCRWAVPMTQADRLVLDQVSDVLAPLADPQQWPALERAWTALTQPSSDSSGQLRQLEREIQTAQRRLADAAALLVDGTLDRAGYEALRDRETSRLAAAESERARLQVTERTPAGRKQPPLSQVLEQAGTWARIIGEVDVAHQRAILDQLVNTVGLRRTGYRSYAADVEWTSLGRMLSDLAVKRAA